MPNLMEMTPEQVSRQLQINLIAEQNDAFRKGPTFLGSQDGQWVWTQAVNAQGALFMADCVTAISEFDDFNEDLDPYGEHGMGKVEVHQQTVWFKIDLYDENYEYGSPDPANKAVTRRVLTIMLPSDY